MIDPNLIAKLDAYADVLMMLLDADAEEFNVPRRMLVEAFADALITMEQHRAVTEKEDA